MPRKKKGEIAPPEGAPEAQPGTETEPTRPADNAARVELTEEQEFALLCQWKRQVVASRDKMADAKRAYDSLKMSHKALGKKVAAECGSDAMERIKELIDLDENEDGEDVLMTRIQRLLWVKQWGGAAQGQQLELYTDLRPIDDRAHEDGKRDGLAGKAFSCKYGQGTSAYRRYQEGWSAGQDILAAGFKPLEKPPEALGDAEPTHTDAG